jgi:hypothetical protein
MEFDVSLRTYWVLPIGLFHAKQHLVAYLQLNRRLDRRFRLAWGQSINMLWYSFHVPAFRVRLI